MKKRLLSILLCLCMAVSMFAVLGASAYAEGETITYTMKEGDTVAQVCQKLGIDFNKNYAWITQTNNIQNYSKIAVGTVLKLPAPGTVLTPPAAQPTTTTTTTVVTNPDGTTTTTTTTTTTGAVPAAATGVGVAGDVVSYYIIPHAMQSGETVYSVCNSLGISFDANANLISALNNVKSYTNLKVGQILLLPSKTAPASGSYYRVMAHKVVSGDTVGALCTAYGIVYEQNVNLLKALNNNRADMTKIKVGETIYIPVPTSGGGGIAPVPSGGGTTPVPSGGGTTPVTPGTVTIPTIKYTLKKGDTVAEVCKKLGVDFWKNYNWITTTNKIQNYGNLAVGRELILPAPGTIAPANGVPEGSGSGGGGGTTPAGGAYTIHTSSNGTYVMQVNGVTVNTASKGQTVTVIPIPDKGYTLNTIEVFKTGASDKVAVTNNSFVMPDYPVTITVTFKAAG